MAPTARRPIPAAPRGARRLLPATLIVGAVLGVAACAPYPAPGTSPTGGATAAPSAPSASPSGSASATADPGFALPASCDELYSPDMRATLEAEVPPLNDPGTTMVSTENAEALEVLGAATETIRCSWGPPSERGMATNVTAVTAEQGDALATAFAQSGFSAEDVDGGTLHRIQQEMITLDDELVTKGEAHYLRDGVWVSTRWINVNPEGYTEDIVASLWG